ncbi:lipopolysaccharide assembly protein LapA domain-containing protein [Leptolyngbyaceae cyanobacterium UHCC 1019]
MKMLPIVLISLIAATWVGAIAILSVQNFTPVKLSLLAFQSVEIPLGLVLAFSVGIGMVGMAIVQLMLTSSLQRPYEED